jgi:hypothetical protein
MGRGPPTAQVFIEVFPAPDAIIQPLRTIILNEKQVGGEITDWLAGVGEFA